MILWSHARSAGWTASRSRPEGSFPHIDSQESIVTGPENWRPRDTTTRDEARQAPNTGLLGLCNPEDEARRWNPLSS